MKNFKEELENIHAFVFDVDGVFTDGNVFITAEGEFLRQYNFKDGMAVVRAIKMGYRIAIISGGRGQQLQHRMESLGIDHIYLEKESKIDSLLDFVRTTGVPMSQICYMGDDYPDLEPMSMVGLSVAPADATDTVRARARHTSAFVGGKGCVRDIIEQVLRARGDWFE
ncbi:MAG: HAD hydrolase family protein [Mucinivorans sp.]